MPKRVVSFKPTPECEVQLAELMDRWGCNRTAALVTAVDVAHKTLMVGTSSKTAVEVMERQKVGAAKIDAVRQVHERNLTQKYDETAKRVHEEAVKPKMRVLTREEREARMAAAQGWLPKGKK